MVNKTFQHRNVKAFSLVEAIVALALATMVIGSMWFLFVSGAKRGSKASSKLDGLKAATTFVQRFEHDGKNIFLDASHGIEINHTGEKRVSFHVYSPEKSDYAANVIGTDKITYYFNTSTHGIYRQVNDEKKKRLRGYYEHLLISTDGSSNRTLNYLITAVGPAFFKKPVSERKAHERVVLQSSIVLWKQLDIDLNNEWNSTFFISSDN